MIDIDEKLNVSELLRVYGALLTPHQAEIMRQYYDCDISLFEIASDLDVSRQAVRDVLVRSVKTLKDVDKKLRLIERSSCILDAINAAKEDAKKGNVGAAIERLDDAVALLEEEYGIRQFVGKTESRFFENA